MKIPGEVRGARAVSRLGRALGEAGGHVSRRSAVEWSSLCVVGADPDSDGWGGVNREVGNLNAGGRRQGGSSVTVTAT